MPNPALSALFSVVEQALPILLRFAENELAGTLSTNSVAPAVTSPTVDAAQIAKAVANAGAQLGAIGAALGTLKSSVQGVPADTSGIQGQIDQVSGAVHNLGQVVASISAALSGAPAPTGTAG